MQNFIYHHGVKGQKWGVRRYQNEDGSLTSAGQARRNKTNETKRHDKIINNNLNKTKTILDSSSSIVGNGKKIADSINKSSAYKKTKNLSNMSDSELRERVNRMNLERQYSDLTANQVSRGRANVGAILDTAGAVLGIGASAVSIALAVREFKKK